MAYVLLLDQVLAAAHSAGSDVESLLGVRDRFDAWLDSEPEPATAEQTADQELRGVLRLPGRG